MDEQGAFSVLVLTQWAGVDGAPKSLWTTGHGTVGKLRLAVGDDVYPEDSV